MTYYISQSLKPDLYPEASKDRRRLELTATSDRGHYRYYSIK